MVCDIDCCYDHYSYKVVTLLHCFIQQESFEIILKHHKPLPSAVRDMAFRYLPTIAKCLDLITSGQQDGDVASLKQLGIMSTPDVFSKLLQLAQEEVGRTHQACSQV